MTDASAAAAQPRLYSQTAHDERGNFQYHGDLHRPREPLPVLCKRIEQHLANHFPASRFAVRGEAFAGGRKVIVETLDHPEELTGRDDRNRFVTTVRDQIERFGFTNSNFYQDFLNCAFYSDVQIGQAYWAALAARRGIANPVDARIPLAALKRRLKVGDRLKLVAAPAHHRALGTTRMVTAVRSGDLILDGHSYLAFPRASRFACDGRLVRIANGNEHEPDAHLLYEWLPVAA